MFGLIGKKLGHSFSPQIHSALADYEYKLLELDENQVAEFIAEFPFEGVNVTIPYKKTVVPYMHTLSDDAKKIGSVNTIKKLANNRLYGDNTDYYGFAYTLQTQNITPRSKKCLVLGSGGASLTARAVLKDMGAQEIIVISRNGENNYANISKHYDADIIINTTPVGMYPDCGKTPVTLNKFTRCEFVFDLIYNPNKTALILDAERLGIQYTNGIVMLAAQAKKSCEIFTGKNIDDSKIGEIVKKLQKQTLNIALVGMPGCGKTTVGKIIAKKLGRNFYDTDNLIEQTYKKPVPSIFAEKGEAFFRKLEENVVYECGRQSSSVIATGGGAITNPKNIDSLRQNGVLVFMNRNIDKLATKNRPLSSDREKLAALYKERIPIYKSCSDIEIRVSERPEILADNIIKELGL